MSRRQPHLKVTLVAAFIQAPSRAEGASEADQLRLVEQAKPEPSGAALLHLHGGPTYTRVGGQRQSCWLTLEHEVEVSCPILHDLVRVSESVPSDPKVRERVAHTVREFMSAWITYPRVEGWSLENVECTSVLYVKGGQS